MCAEGDAQQRRVLYQIFGDQIIQKDMIAMLFMKNIICNSYTP